MSENTPAPFRIFTPADALAESAQLLNSAVEQFGMIPNLEGVMAAAPALLETYLKGFDLFQKTSLTAIEQQIVYQTANFENNCEYCVPWHTLLSRNAGMSPTDIWALRQGSQLSDAKHEALRVFTQSLIRNRGNLCPADLSDFFAAGYTERHGMEVVLGLAIKTMSNYTNSIAQTPLDHSVKRYVWKKPNLKSGAPENELQPSRLAKGQKNEQGNPSNAPY